MTEFSDRDDIIIIFRYSIAIYKRNEKRYEDSTSFSDIKNLLPSRAIALLCELILSFLLFICFFLKDLFEILQHKYL